MKPLAPVTSLAATLAALVLVSACRQPQPEPLNDKPADKPTATTSASAASGESPHAAMGGSAAPGASAAGSAAPAAGPADLAYDAPSTWVSAPPSPMRKATYKIPKVAPDTEDADLSVSSASGGVDANIKRWEGQFGSAKAKTEPRNVNGLKVTMVEIKGSIAAGGMMGMPAAGAKENQMLLGAVIDGGDRQHFFKMVGGEKTVTAAKKDFDKLVSSLRAK